MVYTKNSQTLSEANRFIYQEDIYFIYQKGCQWVRTKYYASSTPINKKDDKAYNKEYKCYIQRYWELIAAPKQYLIDQGFKPKV